MLKPAYKIPILKKHPKSRRILLYVGVVVGTLLTLIHLALFFFFNPLVQEKLIQIVSEKSQGRYSLDVQHISINIFTGSLTVSGAVLSSHPEVIKQLDKMAEPSKMQVKVSKIALRRIKWLTYLNTKSLGISDIDIVSPSIYLSVRTPSTYKSSTDTSVLLKLPALISQFSTGLKVRRINIIDGECFYEALFSGKLLHHQADGINLSFNNVQIDTVGAVEPTNSSPRILFSESIHARLTNYQTITPDSVYKVVVDEMSASTIDSSLSIHRFAYKTLLSDKEFATKLLESKNENLSTTYFKTFQIESFVLRAVNWLKLADNQEVRLAKVMVEQPNIYLQSYSRGVKSRQQMVKQNIFDRLPSLVSKAVAGLKIDSVLVKDATFRYQDVYPTGRSNIQVDNGYVTLKNLEIDTNSVIQSEDIIKNLSVKNSVKSNKVLYCDNILVRFNNLELTAPGSLYAFTIKETSASFADSVLQMTKLTMKPLYGDVEFNKRVVYQNDRFNIGLRKASLKGIQFDRLFKLNDILIRCMDFSDVEINVFRDLRMPRNPARKGAFMPQDAFRDIKFYLRLDTLRFHNANIVYQERAEQSKERGEISFEKTELLCTNLTNDPKLMHPGRLAHINAKTLLMGRGQLTADITIPLLSKSLNFDYSGSLREMDVKHFNRFAIPNESVSVEDGRVDVVSFSATVRNGLAQGNLTALYRDLKIHFLRKEDKSVRKVYSAIGNIILKNNKSRHKKDKQSPPKSEKIEYRRQSTDSFIKFMWISLKSALAASVKS